MKKLFLLLFYCCLQLISFSQPYDPGKVNKKAQQFFDQAYERAADGNYANALGLLPVSYTHLGNGQYGVPAASDQ